MQLAELDRRIGLSNGIRVVPQLVLDESGVDPIGLRQLNLDLMSQAVPGLNNVTDRIRPYIFMTWAMWKASQVDPSGEKTDDLYKRYEALYGLAHLAAGRPMRGSPALRKYLTPDEASGRIRFVGDAWEEYKRTPTGITAPTEYGPSIWTLRFVWRDDGGNRFFGGAMPALLRLDGVIAAALPPGALDIAAPALTLKEIARLAEDLPVEKVYEEEKEAFLKRFYHAPTDTGRRASTIDLMRRIIEDAGPLDLDGLRRRLASRHLPADEDGTVPSALLSASIVHCQLQARQLQRLATEGMLVWLEKALAAEPSRTLAIGEIVAEADRACRKADPLYSESTTVGEYLEAIRAGDGSREWPRAAGEPETDVVQLLADLETKQRFRPDEVPPTALRSFAVVRSVTRSFDDIEFPEGTYNALERNPARLPMGEMSRRMEALSQRPLTSLWKDIFEAWVIGQHVHWSAVRGGDGKKRLRIALEGDGWMLVRPKPSSYFAPTADRLRTLLALMTECGMIRIDEGGRYVSSRQTHNPMS